MVIASGNNMLVLFFIRPQSCLPASVVGQCPEHLSGLSEVSVLSIRTAFFALPCPPEWKPPYQKMS